MVMSGPASSDIHVFDSRTRSGHRQATAARRIFQTETLPAFDDSLHQIDAGVAGHIRAACSAQLGHGRWIRKAGD